MKHVLLQHLTKLYVVHLGVVSQEFFAQQVRVWVRLRLRVRARVSRLGFAGRLGLP